jgi:hypothetical protein
MKWIRERDALIAQTLAFVQSVTGRKEESLLTGPASVTPPTAVEATSVVVIEEVRKVDQPPPAAPPPQPYQLSQPTSSGDFRSEVQARVANFRKHQERFEREREEFCQSTLAKVRDAIRDPPPRPPAAT